MVRQALASVLVLAAMVGIGGCTRSNSVVGRWTSGSTTFYFREDGMLFYRSERGDKFRGRYYVDASSDPLVVQSSVAALAGSKSLDFKLEIEFLTADRMRVQNVAINRDGGVLIFKRIVEGGREADQQQ